MQIHRPVPTTSPATIRRWEAIADRGAGVEAAARAWTDAGFDDEQADAWLRARCFDPLAARALAGLDVVPAQVATRTRDGGDYVDTIGFKVSSGDLTPRQGAVRALSSR